MYWLRPSERLFAEIHTTHPRIRPDGRWGAGAMGIRAHVFEPYYFDRLGLRPHLTPGVPRLAVLSDAYDGVPVRFVRLSDDSLIVSNRFEPVIELCHLGALFGEMLEISPGEPRWLVFR